MARGPPATGTCQTKVTYGVLFLTVPAAQGVEPVAAAIEAIRALDGSTLLVQGPPGAGKTYLSAHAIVALLDAGQRVAISANSHKAINQLLQDLLFITAVDARDFQCPCQLVDARGQSIEFARLVLMIGVKMQVAESMDELAGL